MKRLRIICILVALMCNGVFAEMFYGGFWNMEDKCGSGYGEFGFSLLPKDSYFDLRDSILFGGFSGTVENKNKVPLDIGGGFCGNKLMLGGKYETNGMIIRPYCFVTGGIGVYTCDGHKAFELPLMGVVTGGGGFELQFCKNLAFVIEFGGDTKFSFGKKDSDEINFSKSTPMLTIGYRSLL